MQTSVFTPYSLGIAAENKSLKSKEMHFVPIEALPFIDGELVPSPTPMDFSGIDEQGQSYQGAIFTDNTILATWLPDGSNRFTAPDIRRGERVILYRMENVDKFYWRTLGLDDHLRKLETVIFAISGNPREGNEVLDPENCYFLEMSTHTGQITLQTSKANSEPFAYTFQFNTAEGNVTLADDIGNEFFLNSVENYIKLANSIGSQVELDKKNIRITAPDNVDVKAEKMIRLTTGGTVFTLTPGGTTLKTPSFTGSK